MPQQKSLVLILARGLADELASAMFVVDREGRLAYFNEAAEAILGIPFADVGEVSADEWLSAFVPVDEHGSPIPTSDLPLMVALTDHIPAHKAIRVKRTDGRINDIEVTAFPLFARREELVGAVAIFWENGTSAMKES
jgi:PAS domain S-box-containing protein